MPLFECSKCHVVDNTALGNFWWDVMHEGKPALCAECDPEIGRWHGEFDRMSYADYVKRFGKKAVQFPAKPLPCRHCKKPQGQHGRFARCSGDGTQYEPDYMRGL